MDTNRDLSEGLCYERPVMKKMNRTNTTGIASAKDLESGEYEELLSMREIEEQDELDTMMNLDEELSSLDDGSYQEPVYQKPDNSLNSVIVKAVELARSKNLLPNGWQADEDYVDAVTDIVRKSVLKPIATIKQAIRKLYN